MVDKNDLIKTLSDIISYNYGQTTFSDWKIASHINTIQEALECLQDSELTSVFDEIKYQVIVPYDKFILFLNQDKNTKTITFSLDNLSGHSDIKTTFTNRELKEIEESHNINLSFAIKQKIDN